MTDATLELTPVLSFDPALLLQAQGCSDSGGVRAAIFDVDGVLTDGAICLGEHGELFKSFNSLDGHGLKMLALGGIQPIVITGRDSPAVRRRVADLGIVHARYGVHHKLVVAEALLAELALSWHQVAAIGDDWPDLPLMVRAAFAAAPANAHAEVKARAHHVSTLRGGHGAAREFCDLLLTASGRYAGLLHSHLVTLDDGVMP